MKSTIGNSINFLAAENDMKIGHVESHFGSGDVKYSWYWNVAVPMTIRNFVFSFFGTLTTLESDLVSEIC